MVRVNCQNGDGGGFWVGEILVNFNQLLSLSLSFLFSLIFSLSGSLSISAPISLVLSHAASCAIGRERDQRIGLRPQHVEMIAADWIWEAPREALLGSPLSLGTGKSLDSPETQKRVIVTKGSSQQPRLQVDTAARFRSRGTEVESCRKKVRKWSKSGKKQIVDIYWISFASFGFLLQSGNPVHCMPMLCSGAPHGSSLAEEEAWHIIAVLHLQPLSKSSACQFACCVHL